MKKILLTTITTIVIIATAQANEVLKVGDNLSEYYNDNPPKFQMEGPTIDNWPEGKTFLYSYDKNFDGKTPVLIFSNNNCPIGVLQGIPPNATFIFDIDGDGVLDIKTPEPVLPYWVVYVNSKNKTKNNNISPVMDLVYESFQSDEGPFNNEKVKKALELIGEFKDNTNKENRDLAYMFFFYQRYSMNMPKLSMKCLDLLSKNYINRFAKNHNVLLLYKAETQINMGETENARKTILELLKADPNFIPALSYEYKFETDKEKKKNLLEDLKKKHKNHWIVKQL